MHSANVKYKNYYQNSIYHQQQATQNRHTTPFGRTVVSHKAMPKKRKRNPIANICALGLLVLLGMYVIPYGLKNVVFPFFDYSLYPDIKADTNTIAAPTSNYI
ncbi:hypothetical protein IJV79_02990, partial [bacterium]|nr:hypothetical protein [bacterium]